MLYVQFDAAAGGTPIAAPPGGVVATLRARRIGDVLDSLELHRDEPSMVLLRYAVALALDVDSLATGTWARRGLDVERGFALVVGARREGGRWPLAAAAWPADGAALG